MKTSQKGIKMIGEHEGLRLQAYLCPAGIPTIGYGHTKGVKMGQSITQSQADQFLAEDLADAENAVNAQNLRLNQNQFDALVSFVYNVGAGNFQKSTLLTKAKLNPNDATIAAEFDKWNKTRVNGILTPLKGLTNRRKAELKLYFS
jgi:lysozyme